MTDAVQRNCDVDLLDQIRTTVRRHELMACGEHVVVAVSGGADSVALLAALVMLSGELGIRVSAAHIDHGLRGDESRRDAAHAAAVAAQLGVACVVHEARLSPASANLEERARLQRYAALAEITTALGATRIATAHTRDDQAETVVLRLLRGCGLDGLGGIPVHRGRIVRPLLECPRAAAHSFLAAQGLGFCEDSSNYDRRFLRNRIRHDVLPRLEARSPGMTARLVAVAGQARSEARARDAQLEPVLAAAFTGDGRLVAAALRDLDPVLRGRFVRLWLRRVRGHLRQLGTVHIDQIVALALGAPRNGVATLPGGQRIYVEYGYLCFASSPPTARSSSPQVLPIGTPLAWGGGWRLQATLAPAARALRPDRRLLCFVADVAKLDGSLVVRPPRAGDRVEALGLGGHKKLQDILVDLKIAPRHRHDLPVLEAAGEILWIPGVVRSCHALLSEDTQHTLNVVVEQVGIAGA